MDLNAKATGLELLTMLTLLKIAAPQLSFA
jgi:hypothetical protein